MHVDVAEVERIAKLARLELSETEKERLTHQLNQIFTYMEKLNELDTANVEPFSLVDGSSNVFRADVVQASISREAILNNAPDRNEEYFSVPRAL